MLELLQHKQMSFPGIKGLGREVAIKHGNVSGLSTEERGVERIYM